MKIETALTRQLGIDLPIIVAPMFLVSNVSMLVAAAEAGAMGVTPSLNFRPSENFRLALKEIRKKTAKPFGVNIIVQKSNPYAAEHLKISLDEGVPFYITSLGSPKEVITEAHKNGAKVFCDVVGMEHAEKAVDLGADGLIAVSAGAGGHAGPITATILLPMLKEKFKIPIVAAGGVANGAGFAAMLASGADGVSIGTRFITSTEASVSADYKNAIVNAKVEDIVYTRKLSGSPCSVINTPYVQKLGLDQNWLEKILSNQPTLKKYFKMLVQYRGMKLLENAAHSPTYKDVWCAGQSSALIHDIKSVKEILNEIVNGYSETIKKLPAVEN